VIYYFHNLDVPLFLIAIYAKNIQTDLSPQQRKALAKQLLGLKRIGKRRERNESSESRETSEGIRLRREVAPERATGA
jgi:hypothetical protein